MYSIQCTLESVYCTTVYSVHCGVYSVQQYTEQSAQCTLHSVYCTTVYYGNMRKQ